MFVIPIMNTECDIPKVQCIDIASRHHIVGISIIMVADLVDFRHSISEVGICS